MSNQTQVTQQEQLYYRIRAAARKAGVYHSDADDVAAEAWLIAQERGYYDSRMLREAARNLGLWREAVEAELSESIPAVNDTVRRVQKERIVEAVQHASTSIRRAVSLTLDGYDMGEAAAAVNMSSSQLSLAFARLGLSITGVHRSQRKRANADRQLDIFGEEAA